MDMRFYKEHIEEELEGAKQYIKWAIELKGSKPQWSKNFAEMSSAEVKHAEAIYGMYQEHYESIAGAYKTIPRYVEELHDCIEDMYGTCMEEILEMHNMYNR